MRISAIILRAGLGRWLLVPTILLGWTTVAAGQLLPTIVRVEEDWELVVGTPDADTDAPQVTCVLSPTGDIDSYYATFELNQRSLPVYASGGLQLQVWDGEVPLVERSHPNDVKLTQAGEVVTWTQSMTMIGGGLIFMVKDGQSSSWGYFGGQGHLVVWVPTAINNLNAYSPAVSIGNSGVNYAGNRVLSLTLKRVRAYTDTGEVLEEEVERVVHSLD